MEMIGHLQVVTATVNITVVLFNWKLAGGIVTFASPSYKSIYYNNLWTACRM